MGRSRYLITDIIYNIVWLAFFYGIFMVPAVMLLGFGIYGLLPLMSAVFFYFFLVRRFIKPVWLMVPAHFIALFAVWHIGPSLPHQLFYVAAVMLMMIFSFIQRYRPAQTFSVEFSYLTPIVLISLAILAGFQDYGHMVVHYAALIIITSVGGKLQSRMADVNSTLEIITQNSTQPVTKILSFDYKAVFMLGLALVGLILLLNRLLIRPVLEAIARWLSTIPPIEIADTVPYTDIFGGTGQMGGDEFLYFLMTDAESALFWRILEWITLYIFVPILFLVLIVFAGRAIRNLLISLGLKKSEVPELAGGFEDIKEFIRTSKPKRSWFFGPRNENSIRRRFRETVTRQMKKGVPIQKSDTPAQMAGKIQTEDISALAEEYAAVRYRG